MITFGFRSFEKRSFVATSAYFAAGAASGFGAGVSGGVATGFTFTLRLFRRFTLRFMSSGVAPARRSPPAPAPAADSAQ